MVMLLELQQGVLSGTGLRQPPNIRPVLRFSEFQLPSLLSQGCDPSDDRIENIETTERGARQGKPMEYD